MAVAMLMQFWAERRVSAGLQGIWAWLVEEKGSWMVRLLEPLADPVAVH